MQDRWIRLQELFATQDIYVLKSVPNTSYAWIQCKNMTSSQCASKFSSVAISGYGSELFGVR